MENVFQAFDRFGFYFFQMLLAFLWQSSLVLIPVLLALRIFRKSIPALRNSIAISGIVGIPAIVLCSLLVNIIAVPGKPIPVMPEYGPAKTPASGITARTNVSGYERSAGLAVTTAGEDAPSPAGAGAAAESFTLSLPNPLRFPWACGLLVYCLIQIILIVKLIRECIAVRRWIGESRAITDIPVCRVFWHAAHELELRTGKFELMESSLLRSPVTAGAIMPRVILPRKFSDACDDENMETIAFHELAHVRRKDPLIFTIISAARTVLFFHPLLLLLAHEFSLIAEQDCDEIAIMNSGMSRRSYAQSLARIAETLTSSTRPMQALGLFFGRSVLIQRFESILSRRRMSRRHRVLIPAVAFICIAIPLAIAISLPLGERDPGSQKTVPLPRTIQPDRIAPAENMACAIPLGSIQIDGDLGDWPAGMVQYPIRNTARVFGATDIDSTDLGSSSDLSPSMMVGYNEEAGLLYVAVTVRDDRVITTRNPENADPELTDACELYVAGSNQTELPKPGKAPLAVWDMATLKYVMCPDGGAYDLSAWLREPPYTPVLFRGTIKSTGSTCVCTRKGDITTYEWAVRVYNRYPEAPLDLFPGTVIRFDVAVADRDSATDRLAWATWGPCKMPKCYDASLLGTLMLVNRYEDISVVSGHIARGSGSYASAKLAFYRGMDCALTCNADASGRFRVALPPGTYTVKVRDKMHEHFYQDKLAVAPGSLVTANLRVSLGGFSRLQYEYVMLFESFRKRIESSGMTRFAFSLGTRYQN